MAGCLLWLAGSSGGVDWSSAGREGGREGGGPGYWFTIASGRGINLNHIYQ